jgi:hypothetical protein
VRPELWRLSLRFGTTPSKRVSQAVLYIRGVDLETLTGQNVPGKAAFTRPSLWDRHISSPGTPEVPAPKLRGTCALTIHTKRHDRLHRRSVAICGRAPDPARPWRDGDSELRGRHSCQPQVKLLFSAGVTHQKSSIDDERSSWAASARRRISRAKSFETSSAQCSNVLKAMTR